MQTLPNLTRLTPAQIAEALNNAGYRTAPADVLKATYRPTVRPADGRPAFMYQCVFADADAPDGFVYVSVAATGLVVAEF